jgi:hypothetical protein
MTRRQSDSGMVILSALMPLHFFPVRQNHLHPALAAGLIERTLPDAPNSRLQKYRLAAMGRACL